MGEGVGVNYHGGKVQSGEHRALGGRISLRPIVGRTGNLT